MCGHTHTRTRTHTLSPTRTHTSTYSRAHIIIMLLTLRYLLLPEILDKHILAKFKRKAARPFHLSIYVIYIAPLQVNYSEALPTQARPKRKVLSSL